MISTNDKEVPLYMAQKSTVTAMKQRFDVCIRGWRVKQYIIFDCPMMNGEPMHMAPHTGVEIHYIREGTYITFKTNVLFIHPSIVTLMVVEYPREFDKVNMRKADRHKVNFPVSFSAALTNHKTITDRGTLRDLSMNGALMTFPQSLQKDTKLTLKAVLDVGTLDAEAVVQNVRHNPKGDKEPFVTGVKFANVSESSRDMLRKFFESRQQDMQKMGQA